ncbi:hypothetical protein CCH79_00004380 [Gambusia affinis]|uniref:Uncharacterized protein n=1 Tax=Gambusia affinis TaxID=33528 RepID=A0A315UYL5_GAMAF|nr:hypothetical protein CCH79_00004380 [Gambusia affinis]
MGVGCTFQRSIVRSKEYAIRRITATLWIKGVEVRFQPSSHTMKISRPGPNYFPQCPAGSVVLSVTFVDVFHSGGFCYNSPSDLCKVLLYPFSFQIIGLTLHCGHFKPLSSFASCREKQVLKNHLLLFRLTQNHLQIGFDMYEQLPAIRAKRLETVLSLQDDSGA